MASEFDQSDFVDSEFQAGQRARAARLASAAPGGPVAGRPPTREELEAKVTETQQRLMELKRVQENLERERAALEEARRRQNEFQLGREEMTQHLTRGLGLLSEAEFAARREAEQMAKTLGGLREVLAKLQDIKPETWTTDNYDTELTRALTAIENARMEWNSALLKWPLLSAKPAEAERRPGAAAGATAGPWEGRSFGQLCRVGLALSWPLALVALAAVVILAILLFQR